ncbi:hypothetical protein NPIL_489201 [Nephila pilipes]|uniref:Uncharacterized protein n=1 Tax=Nephila pilipes TaxID=299642 RepID=A0A8X6N006_NEPPI|nr:hypothetical protein NPIL_489201 [Nephila pilipes]
MLAGASRVMSGLCWKGTFSIPKRKVTVTGWSTSSTFAGKSYCKQYGRVVICNRRPRHPKPRCRVVTWYGKKSSITVRR